MHQIIDALLTLNLLLIGGLTSVSRLTGDHFWPQTIILSLTALLLLLAAASFIS